MAPSGLYARLCHAFLVGHIFDRQNSVNQEDKHQPGRYHAEIRKVLSVLGSSKAPPCRGEASYNKRA